MPIKTSHSVIESPESVILVAPPTKTNINNRTRRLEAQIIREIFVIFFESINVYLFKNNLNNGKKLLKLKQKTKKLIGTIIIPIWLLFFLAIIGSLGEILLPRLNQFETFLFYLIGGIAWIIPLMPLISWMQKDKNQSNLP
ncbi:MAG: DUF2842 domain-containing protein [Rhizobiales bacterium TMED168]|nr:MAG: DUF2842 domain-containing protein [Rhizobiales bacterium TMED168]